jgi:hypothetical protein
MAQLPSPYANRPFTKVEGHLGYHYTDSHTEIVPALGQDEYGRTIETSQTVEIPHDPEVVNIHNGVSNSQYWQPELVLNPEGCQHQFVVTDIGLRELECLHCHIATSFHAGRNVVEEQGQAYVVFHNKRYPITI